MATHNNITIEGARIKYRNFAGKEKQFNPVGRRNFCLILDDETAEVLAKDGWNVKPDEYDGHTLQVAVEYKNYPPKIVQISGNNQTILTEKQVGLLDDAEILNIDLIVRPYNYNVNGKAGVKAYCKTMYVTIQEDFGGKYSSIPYSEEDVAMEEQMNDIPF